MTQWDIFFLNRFQTVHKKQQYYKLKSKGYDFDLEDTWEDFCKARREWLKKKQ